MRTATGNTTTNNKHQYIGSYIPNDIIRSSLSDSNTLVENGYDPTVCNLFDIVTLSSGIQKIACATGSGGTTLEVSELNVHSMSIPEIAGDPFRVDFNEQIKHILWSQETQVEERRKTSTSSTSQYHLMVMTDNVIYIFESSNNNRLLMELTASDIEGVSFAAAVFSPFDPRLFCAIDKQGNFILWHLDGGILFQEKYHQDETELSSWKKVCWGSTPSSLYIGCRSGMREYEVLSSSTPKVYDIITTNTWSKLLDFKVCSTNRHYGFLLTSKELIMIRTTPTTTREVSWKHFLSDTDPSLKLTLLEDGNDVHCVIYSVLHEVVILYRFGLLDNGKPIMGSNPYILKEGIGSNQHVQLINLLECFKDEEEEEEDRKVVGLFEMNCSHCLSATLLTDKEGLSLNQTRDKIVSKSPTKSKSQPKERHKVFQRFSKKQFRPMLQQIQKTLDISIDNREPDMDIELVQDYAYKLGSALNKVEDSKVSLLDLAKEIPQSEDLEEFDSMIEQLVSYFETKNITISTSQLAKLLGVDNLESLFELQAMWLKNNHASSYNLSMFVTLVGLSLLRCNSATTATESSDTLESELQMCGDDFVKDLLDSWDTVINEDPHQHNIERKDEALTTRVVDEIPTIRITQTQSQNNHTIQQPIATSPRAQMAINLGSQSPSSPRKLLLGSSQRFGLSQALSLSQRSLGQHPKRKKRRGGFN
ncbi:uncharacterized protein KQ657_003736 [Scheffersomyces spartinae]|uniref:Uncharacterized protein n=1 Tax=Scheffersomyces spartinae TaxID=45513 RepID=A0A9P8AJV0_9ASCO|nr:uncharacterized protein KQ657_003736 [Scheffersomyces spartinae]KAG7195210.1 hypothetical protein KQ657_003736 [Scheffersomyces spartinae]